jgi:hypothetical protein
VRTHLFKKIGTNEAEESVEARSDNATSNAMWTNKVSEGLMLNPGDRVSISSAFINEVGSGEDTIQFTDGDTRNAISDHHRHS